MTQRSTNCCAFDIKMFCFIADVGKSFQRAIVWSDLSVTLYIFISLNVKVILKRQKKRRQEKKLGFTAGLFWFDDKLRLLLE